MDVQRIVSTHISLGVSSSSPSTSTPAPLPTLASDPPPQQLVDGVSSGEIGLLDVVRALGEYLTSTEDPIRIRGINILTGVLTRIPESKINRQGTQVLTNFFTDKLEDSEALSASLTALITLSKLPTFGSGESVQVWNGLVEHVRMKSHVQPTRHLVFTLIDALMKRHREAFKNLGPGFISQYVKLAEGEKDPRNLMLVFGIDLVILLDLDPWIHLEDLFDIIFCYFPITFRPPPGDPYGITADDLKLALRKCMAASARFAPLAMPLFLEKLPPSLGESKKDTLKSLTACLPVYGAQAIQGYAKDLWDALKPEIYYSSDKEIEQDSLETLKTLISTLYPTEEIKDIDFAIQIIKDCMQALKEPEKAKAMAATKILATIFKASAPVGQFMLSQVLPQLFKQYHQESEVPHRGPIIDLISHLLMAVKETYMSAEAEGAAATPKQHRTYASEKPLELYRDQLLNIIGSGIDNPLSSVQKPALDGIIQLIHIHDFLTLQEITYLVQRINSLLESLDDVLRTEAVLGLVTISQLSTRPIEDTTLPDLFAKLPDSAPAIGDEEARFWYRQTLKALSQICVQPGLFERLMIRTLFKLQNLVENSPPKTDVVGRECAVAYAYSLINTLSTTLRSKASLKHKDIPMFFDQLNPRMFSLAAHGPSSQSIMVDCRLLAATSALMEVTTENLSTERQGAFAEKLFLAYQTGDMQSLMDFKSQPLIEVICPLSMEASPEIRNLVIPFAGAVIALQPSAIPSTVDLDNLLSSLVIWSIDAPTTTFQYTCFLITSLVNKRAEHLGDFIDALETSLWKEHILEATIADTESVRFIKLWIWLSRALVVRNHAAGYSMLTKVLNLFQAGHPLGPPAASSLAILADKTGDRVLSKANYATVKALHKQKLFNFLLPALVSGCKSSERSEQLIYLSAFGSLITIIPRSMIVDDLPSLLPIIIRGTSSPSCSVRANMLETLYSIMESEDDGSRSVIEDQAKGLVDALLSVAQDQKKGEGSPRARIQALRCLSILPDALPLPLIKSLKSLLVKELGKTVDDPKKEVRKEAVDARAVWYKQQGLSV